MSEEAGELLDFSIPEDTKPKRRTRRKKGLSKTVIETKLNTSFSTVGKLWAATDPMCGTVFLNQSGDIASALANLAETHPKLKAALSASASFGDWGQLAWACMPLVVTVGVHHNLFPEAISKRLMSLIGNDLVNLMEAMSDNGNGFVKQAATG